MSSADKTNHSAAGTLHPHSSATFFLYTLGLTKIYPFPISRFATIHFQVRRTDRQMG